MWIVVRVNDVSSAQLVLRSGERGARMARSSASDKGELQASAVSNVIPAHRASSPVSSVRRANTQPYPSIAPVRTGMTATSRPKLAK